jgi:murein L,D-transpeptidase YafK
MSGELRMSVKYAFGRFTAWGRSAVICLSATPMVCFASLADADVAKSLAPIPPATVALMTAKHTTPAAPLVIRTYKKEAELEVWKLNAEGRYVYIKTFPICRWSGQLGPKHHAGDRQTPEGFYPIGPKQMNPNSHYYLSFDTGFPNAYDKAHGATGSAVMVHGTCSSMGCFAMTDKEVGEIYAIARDALKGGQPAFQMQAYPFHMTAKNMALYRSDVNIAFWNQLKEGSDRFESTGELLQTSVVAGKYAFAPSKDLAKEAAAKAFHEAEQAKVVELIADGSAAVRTTYSDGGQNAIFAALMKKGVSLGDVSRPEALAFAGLDVTLVPARRHRRPTTPVVATAEATKAMPLVAALVHAHATPLPETIEPVALMPQLLRYSLYHPPVTQTLIAGAMPMRAAVLAN